MMPHSVQLVSDRHFQLTQVPGVQVKGAQGKPDSFEVSVNGQLIFSKLETGSFPDDEMIKKQVKEMIGKEEKPEKTSKKKKKKKKCVLQ